MGDDWLDPGAAVYSKVRIACQPSRSSMKIRTR